MIKEAKLYKLEVSTSEIKDSRRHPTTFSGLETYSTIKNPEVIYVFSYQQRVTNSEALALCAVVEAEEEWHLFSASLNGLQHVETVPLVTGIRRFFNIRPSPQQLARALKLHNVHSFKLVKKDASEFLQEFEESEINSQRNRKYGILLENAGQTTDEEILFNTGVNPSFDAFVANLGQRTVLSSGFKGYSGGLDLKGRTGDLLYRCIDDLELAGHVGPWLKHVANDDQEVEKKRHIGNDNLVVLYERSGCEFDPSEFKSQMIYCWVVVQEMTTENEALELDKEGKCHFRVSIAYRKFVNLAGPHILPELERSEVMDKTQFYSWLEEKILDIIHGFYEAGDLQVKMQRHRQSIVDGFLK